MQVVRQKIKDLADSYSRIAELPDEACDQAAVEKALEDFKNKLAAYSEVMVGHAERQEEEAALAHSGETLVEGADNGGLTHQKRAQPVEALTRRANTYSAVHISSETFVQPSRGGNAEARRRRTRAQTEYARSSSTKSLNQGSGSIHLRSDSLLISGSDGIEV